MAPPKKWVSSISFHPRLRSYGPSLKMVMEPSRSQQLKFGHTSLEKETLINSSTYVSSSFHGSKKWVPFKMKVSSAVQICSRGWSQCQGINVWYTSLLGSFKVKGMFICISCICRTARCTNRCFRHEAKGSFQLGIKNPTSKNYALSLYPLSVQVVKHILQPLRGVRRNAPHHPAPPVLPVPRLQGSPAMHLPEGALLIPPRRANGITTWSKNQSFGVYPNTCLMFSVHLFLLFGEQIRRASPKVSRIWPKLTITLEYKEHPPTFNLSIIVEKSGFSKYPIIVWIEVGNSYHLWVGIHLEVENAVRKKSGSSPFLDVWNDPQFSFSSNSR